MVSIYDESIVPRDAWADLTNFDIGQNSLPVARFGFVDFNSSVLTLDSESADFRALKMFTLRSNGGVAQATVLVAIVETGTPKTYVYKSDLDGVWDVVSNPWDTQQTNGNDIVICDNYAVFLGGRSLTPKKWDQTTASDLGTSAPNAFAGAYHLRRLFLLGTASGDGSSVSYSASGDITDWTGADTGSFVIDEGEGDFVVGVSESFQDDIYFFTGPEKGGVHRLSGGTPATFTRRKLANGAPCAANKSVITTENDVYWMSLQGFHSLKALGSGEDSCISAPIEYAFRTKLESVMATITGITDVRGKSWGFHDPTKHHVGWSLAGDSTVFVYNYRFKKWSTWTLPVSSPLSATFDPYHTDASESKPRLFVGSSLGFVTYADRDQYVDDANGGAAAVISLTARTPQIYTLDNKPPQQEAVFERMTVFAKDADRLGGTPEAFSLGISATSSTAVNVVEPATIRAPASVRGMEYAKTTMEGRDTWVQLTFDNTDFTTSTTVRPMIAGYAIDFFPGEMYAAETA